MLHYDRRGRGDSGDTQPYAVKREVEDLEALIEEAGGSAFVFGMSSGAVLALDAAAGDLAITKLALYEPPFNNPGIWGLLDDNARPAAENYTKQLMALLAEGRRVVAGTLGRRGSRLAAGGQRRFEHGAGGHRNQCLWSLENGAGVHPLAA